MHGIDAQAKGVPLSDVYTGVEDEGIPAWHPNTVKFLNNVSEDMCSDSKLRHASLLKLQLSTPRGNQDAVAHLEV